MGALAVRTANHRRDAGAAKHRERRERFGAVASRRNRGRAHGGPGGRSVPEQAAGRAPSLPLRVGVEGASYSRARVASLSTVFQLRPVARVPSLRSISVLVSFDTPTPIG